MDKQALTRRPFAAAVSTARLHKPMLVLLLACSAVAAVHAQQPQQPSQQPAQQPALRGAEAAARAAMENPTNPLLLMETTQGNIYLELLPAEAPRNVANVLALAAGEVELLPHPTDADLTQEQQQQSSRWRRRSRSREPAPPLPDPVTLPFYDGSRFHRVIPGYLIQTGSPLLNPQGMPRSLLADEINADDLGLQDEPLILTDGSINPLLGAGDQEDFAEAVLRPLYGRLGIDNLGNLLSRQDTVLQRLQQMSIKDVLENQNYSFDRSRPSRPVNRGVVALANTGPDSNGPEFFIPLADAPALTGRHTVIGRVVQGMEVVDAIGRVPVQPQDTRFSSVVYRLRQIN